MSDSTGDVRDRIRRRLPVLWQFVLHRLKRGERYGLDFTLAFLAIAGAMWLFVDLVEDAVTTSQVFILDSKIQNWMAALLSPGLTHYVVFITHMGGTRGTAIGVVLIGVLLLLRRRWWNLFGLVFATAGGGFVDLGLKELFHRARPTAQVIHAGGYAFPSGHAFAAMVFFGYLIYLAWKNIHVQIARFIVTVLCLAMIFLIGASRVYLNVHWVTDVLGGYLAGFCWLIVSILIVRHVEWPNRKRPDSTADKLESPPP